ncbi:MAG: tetratricopeptide repeat protein [Planctomycetota bacterium]|jgi:tetratricopeptide (TPR) repeat protein
MNRWACNVVAMGVMCAVWTVGGGSVLADEPIGSATVSDTVANGAELTKTGKYAEAVTAYRGLGEGHLGKPEVAIALADTLAMQGKYAEAAAALQAGKQQGEAQAAWRVAVAEVLARMGKYAEALDHAAGANELSPKWSPAILLRGQLLETLGRDDEAMAVYETMQQVVADGAYKTDARQLVALGQILDRYAGLKGLKASEQANNIFNNYFQLAYQDVDERYWPAHVAAGRFALSKRRFKTAGRELASALKINPNIPEALAALAALELQQWRFEQCQALVDKALAVNPNSVEALKVRAMCLLQWRKIDQAPAVLERALAVNPNDVEALSLAAAAAVRLDQSEEAAAYSERVKAVNPRSWVLPAAIGQWLAAARQFEQAEVHLQEAVELAPKAAEPRTALGLLYMQTGEEDKARETLKIAHEIDDFRADAVNYLNLLAKMQDFSVIETDHVIVAVDGEHDAVLLDQVAEEADRIYLELCEDFGHTPAEKTKVQLFPTHQQFSVRITGRGWIGTVGACTGRVVAMVAPSEDRSRFGNYNWSTVLRHELTHAITLSATGNRIPHWFTEACAVWQQPDRRNYDSVRALVTAVREDRLFKIRELNWGFIRPKRRGDRGLAYAQSELAMEYIIESKGFDSIGKMLTAFRDGQPQVKVFADVLGMTEDEFDEGFEEWASHEIGGWGFDVTPTPDLAAAARAAEQTPDDPEALATHALALFRRGRTGPAAEIARKILALDPDHPRGLEIAAYDALAEEDYAEAARLGQRLEAAVVESPAAAHIAAEAHLGLRDYPTAITSLVNLQFRRPLEPLSYVRLTNIYTQMGRSDKALPNLIELHRRTLNEEAYARQIAEYFRATGDDEQALSYFRQVTHIDPYEASAYEAIAGIHRNARRYDEAVKAAARLTMLQPKSAEAWAKLAMVRFVAARSANNIDAMLQARDEAATSAELDADGPGGSITERIEAALETLQGDQP